MPPKNTDIEQNPPHYVYTESGGHHATPHDIPESTIKRAREIGQLFFENEKRKV